MSWIAAIIEDNNGDKIYTQFDDEEELEWYLAHNEGYKLIKVERSKDNG